MAKKWSKAATAFRHGWSRTKTELSNLEAALSALGYRVAIEVYEQPAA